ncbi:MAG: hypothetical protein AAB443_04120 [Patescibacteria group bacterium]
MINPKGESIESLKNNWGFDVEHNYSIKVVVGASPSQIDRGLFHNPEAVFRLIKISDQNATLLDPVSFVLRLDDRGSPRVTNLGTNRVRIFDQNKETLGYVGRHMKFEAFWEQFSPISTIDIVCKNDFIFRFKVLECALSTKYELLVNPKNTDTEDWIIRNHENFLEELINE